MSSTTKYKVTEESTDPSNTSVLIETVTTEAGFNDGCKPVRLTATGSLGRVAALTFGQLVAENANHAWLLRESEAIKDRQRTVDPQGEAMIRLCEATHQSRDPSSWYVVTVSIPGQARIEFSTPVGRMADRLYKAFDAGQLKAAWA